MSRSSMLWHGCLNKLRDIINQKTENLDYSNNNFYLIEIFKGILIPNKKAQDQ